MAALQPVTSSNAELASRDHDSIIARVNVGKYDVVSGYDELIAIT
jgi:hypothetical protein